MLNRWSSHVLLRLLPCVALVGGCGGERARGASSGSGSRGTSTGSSSSGGSPPPSVCTELPTASPTPPPSGRPFTVVTADSTASSAFQLALQACVGLSNRKAPGSVYVELSSYDPIWLQELDLTPTATVTDTAFLSSCLAEFPSCVRYDYASQEALLPSVLSVGAALSAVPLDDNLSLPCGTVAFDATTVLKDRNTPALATPYAFDTYGSKATGLAMLDPGYDQDGTDNANPALTGTTNPGLVDFVFSSQLVASAILLLRRLELTAR